MSCCSCSISKLVSVSEADEIPGFFCGEGSGVDVERCADFIAEPPFEHAQLRWGGVHLTTARRIGHYHRTHHLSAVGLDMRGQIRQRTATSGHIIHQHVTRTALYRAAEIRSGNQSLHQFRAGVERPVGLHDAGIHLRAGDTGHVRCKRVGNFVPAAGFLGVRRNVDHARTVPLCDGLQRRRQISHQFHRRGHIAGLGGSIGRVPLQRLIVAEQEVRLASRCGDAMRAHGRTRNTIPRSRSPGIGRGFGVRSGPGVERPAHGHRAI